MPSELNAPAGLQPFAPSSYTCSSNGKRSAPAKRRSHPSRVCWDEPTEVLLGAARHGQKHASVRSQHPAKLVQCRARPVGVALGGKAEDPVVGADPLER